MCQPCPAMSLSTVLERCTHVAELLAETCCAEEALVLSRTSSIWAVALSRPAIWRRYLGGAAALLSEADASVNALARPVLADPAAAVAFLSGDVHPENYRAIVAALRAPGWARRYETMKRRIAIGYLRIPLTTQALQRDIRQLKHNVVRARAKEDRKAQNVEENWRIALDSALSEQQAAPRTPPRRKPTAEFGTPPRRGTRTTAEFGTPPRRGTPPAAEPGSPQRRATLAGEFNTPPRRRGRAQQAGLSGTPPRRGTPDRRRILSELSTPPRRATPERRPPAELRTPPRRGTPVQQISTAEPAPLSQSSGRSKGRSCTSDSSSSSSSSSSSTSPSPHSATTSSTSLVCTPERRRHMAASPTPEKLTTSQQVNSNSPSKYQGALSAGEPHGQGTCRWANGRVYEGQFQLGRMHGEGRLLNPDGRTYEGSFVDGQPHGMGVLHGMDGSLYNGEFAAGRRHGHGRQIFADDRVYEGQFEAGQPHGHGRLVSSAGELVHEGLFSHGRTAHGSSMQTSPVPVKRQLQRAGSLQF